MSWKIHRAFLIAAILITNGARFHRLIGTFKGPDRTELAKLALDYIKNVDYDTDFNIDESLSSGDEVYFIVAIQPVDSAEKLYFTVKTR